jgi:hypothetical protein
MDRVVGSSLIPNWGFIDGQTFESGGISKILITRLFASFIVLLVLAYLIFIARPLNLDLFENGQNFLAGSMLLTLSGYWAVAGLFFSPEPRYAIFPSLCLVLIFLMSLDSIFSDQKTIKIERFVLFVTSILFISIFASAFQVSNIRNTDQIWREQIAAGKAACKAGKLQQVEIEIPPRKNDLLLSLNCKLLR